MPYERLRGIGPCKGCGKRALGTTTVARRVGADPVEYSYHYCDACTPDAPRPLASVLADHIAALREKQ